MPQENIDQEAVAAQLQATLAELETRAQHIAGDLAEPADADSSEQAVQREDDDALGGQAALVAREIASVRRALERVADGSYGECVRCGEDIQPARLAARPEAALCITCASQEG